MNRYNEIDYARELIRWMESGQKIRDRGVAAGFELPHSLAKLPETTTDPAPVRDAAESEPLNVWDQCDALRARVASLESELACEKAAHLVTAREFEFQRERAEGLEAELAALRTDRELQRGYIADVREEARDARALLAVERERVIEECAKACDAFAEEDRGTSQCVGASLCADRIRALAQPRAERETK